MKALTLIQPWATAILRWGKTVENRPWAPPDSLIGERIAIHAGRKVDRGDIWSLLGHLPQWDMDHQLPQGAILGTATLLGYEDRGRGLQTAQRERLARLQDELRRSPFKVQGAVWWVLVEPKLLPEPIPCRGLQKLWNVPPDIAAKLEELT